MSAEESKLQASLMLAEVKGWATLAANRLDPSHPGLDSWSQDKTMIMLSWLQTIVDQARHMERDLLSASLAPTEQAEAG